MKKTNGMKHKIAIIAGHSNSAPGALCYDGSYEHDHTHTLQQMVVHEQTNALLMQGSSFYPVTDHEDLSLRSVVNLLNANKSIAGILDIHFNANMTGATGVEAIVHPYTSEENKQLAASMVYILSGIIGIPIRRREPERDYIYPSETPRGTLAIIDQTKAPAIIIEVCFLNESNMIRYIAKRKEVSQALRKLMFA